jgi:CheY-like chemotaxis protein
LNILVVEDEPLIRLGLAELAEEWGYRALEASNADEALTVISREPDVGVVITDVDMPGSMDGLGLAHLIRDRWPAIGVIVTTGKVSVAASDLPAGVPFLQKPCRDNLLLETVRRLTAAGAAR